MAKATIVVLVGAFGLWANGAQAAQDCANDTIRKAGDAFIAAGSSDGLSIAVVKDGKTVFCDFGTVERGKARLPTPDTVYEIGSISKTFGSLLLAQAIVAGKAQVDDDMRRYLPPGEYPGLVYQGQAVTLRNLVSTTSALPDNLPDELTRKAKEAKPEDKPFVLVEGLNRYTMAGGERGFTSGFLNIEGGNRVSLANPISVFSRTGRCARSGAIGRAQESGT